MYGGKTGVSGDAAVQYFLSHGATASKMTFGMPIYGRAFEATSGIYQAYSGVRVHPFMLPQRLLTHVSPLKQIGPGTWEAGVYDYKALPFAGAQVHEDMSALASYSYDPSKKELVSYDTPAIAKAKASKPAGATAAAMAADDAVDGLTKNVGHMSIDHGKWQQAVTV